MTEAVEHQPVSGVIEALAAHVAEHWPDRLLASLEQVSVAVRTPIRDPSRLRVDRIGTDDSDILLRVLAEAGPVLTATASVRDARGQPPPGDPGRLTPLEGANAEALYDLDVAPSASQPATPRILRSVRQVRSGRLDGALEYPSASALPGGLLVGHTGPVAIEGMLQLARWTWYAFAGDRSLVEGFERLTWFRLPRPGERIRLEATLRGTRAELPCLDVLARTHHGGPLAQLTGLRLVPLEPYRDAFRPRAHWQRFLSLVSGTGARQETA